MSDEDPDYASIGRALLGDPWSPAKPVFRFALPTGGEQARTKVPEGATVFSGRDGEAVQTFAAAYGQARRQQLSEQQAEQERLQREAEPKPKSEYVFEMERLAEQRTKLDAIAAKLRQVAAESPPEATPGPYDAAIARVQRDLQFKERRRQVKAENKAARAILKAQRSGGAR